MDQQTFNSLFRDLISRIYDRVAIENHPLISHFAITPDPKIRRAEAIQRLILGEIEHLRPPGAEILWQSQEWRPYLILSKRYVEAQDPSDIARSLYIGDRQFRRDHSRALQALSARIWEGYFLSEAEEGGEPDSEKADGEEQQDFEFHPENLDLREVIEGVLSLTSRRIASEHIQLNVELANTALPVFTDRVVLRQVFLSLLNYVLHLRAGPEISLRANADAEAGHVFSLVFEADEQWASIQSDEQDTLEFVRKLSLRLPTRLEETYPEAGSSGQAQIRLVFVSAKPKSVLMVDDQPATLKMFQRYLSGTSLNVTGLNDPALAVENARQLQPSLIMLDVMMPRIDGWEILQALQLDPQTKNIPIIVCSAWGEPELARSLGAAEFLKKPVIQKDLLAALARLGVIQE